MKYQIITYKYFKDLFIIFFLFLKKEKIFVLNFARSNRIKANENNRDVHCRTKVVVETP